MFRVFRTIPVAPTIPVAFGDSVAAAQLANSKLLKVGATLSFTGPSVDRTLQKAQKTTIGNGGSMTLTSTRTSTLHSTAVGG